MKRRVIAIAVVLAAVAVCASLWMNEGPLWRAVMLKRVLDKSDSDFFVLDWEWRWGNDQREYVDLGPGWELDTNSGSIDCIHVSNDALVSTKWDSRGEIVLQIIVKREAETVVPGEERTSPPWWPHPPLIDLREFEE